MIILLFSHNEFSGLSTFFFQDQAAIQEVVCNGEKLPSSHNLLSLALFREDSNAIIAVANLAGTGMCTTSANFVACEIDEVSGKMSVLRVLIQDLSPGQWRFYGCNLTALENGQTRIHHWSINVSRPICKYK